MAHVEIAASNLNIEPAAALRFTSDDYNAFLTDGGFDTSAGYEWSDVRIPAVRKAARILGEQGMIHTVHESRNEQTILASLAGGVSAVKIAAAFPLLDKSYSQLAKVQEAAHQKLPLVLHPAGQHLAEAEPRRPRQTAPEGMFDELWYQPTVEWANFRGIHTDSEDTAAIAEQIITQQQWAGLDKMALDLHHLQAVRNGMRFRNPVDLAVALASSETLGELQVAIRPDFGGDKAELIAATDGRIARTQTGEILTAIAEALPPERKLRIVSEIAATEINKSGFSDLSAAHSMINSGIRQIFS